MTILSANAGSTSLKFRLLSFPEEKTLSRGSVERIGSVNAAWKFEFEDGRHTEGVGEIKDYRQGIGLYLDFIKGLEYEAVAFKAVLAKGFDGVCVITDEVLEGMRETLSVAPAHNSAYISAIEAFRAEAPDKIRIASFETGFHASIPVFRRVYPVPYEWYSSYGVKRMGYHGASHEGMAQAMHGYKRAISCHLGGSGSICAILDGKSVDTSFGLSLQAGLPHVNRCGDIDPYIINYMLSKGLSYEEVMRGLEVNGGLKGISGLSGDMRDLRAAAKEGSKRAQLAIDVYVASIVKYIGAFTAEMGGLDALGFTGGIGENDFETRKSVCEGLGFLGIRLDDAKNTACQTRIEAEGALPVFVIKANEELTVARKAYKLLKSV